MADGCIVLIETTIPFDITNTTAETGGFGLFANGAITARGVAWSTSPTPTISGSYTSDGTGSTPYDSSLAGLTANTTYYVRAYATTTCGTFYGQEWSFKTSAQSYSLNQCDTSEIEILPGETFVIPEGAEIQGVTNVESIESECVNPDVLKDLEEPQCYAFMFGNPEEDGDNAQWGEEDRTVIRGLKIKGKSILLTTPVTNNNDAGFPYTVLVDLDDISSNDDIIWRNMCPIDDGASKIWFFYFTAKPSYVNKIKMLISMASLSDLTVPYELIPYSKIKIEELGFETPCNCEEAAP